MSWDFIFPEAIIPEGSPGATTGGIFAHEEAGRRWNAARRVIYIGPTGTEADIADALADAHDAGHGKVVLTGSSYEITGLADPALDIYLPTIELDLGGAVLNYTGDDRCLRVRMNPFTITNAGKVHNGTIDGSDAGPGAVGIETGSVIRHRWEGVTVRNFDKAGSVNWDWYNSQPDSWTERCVVQGCDSRNGTVDWQFRAVASSPSYLYQCFADARFDTGAGQTAIKTIAPAQLFDCEFGFRGNVNDGGTVFDLAPVSILRPVGKPFSVEQTSGLDADLFAPGSAQLLYPRGTWAINNFPFYDNDRRVADYQGKGETVTMDLIVGNTLERPYQALGLVVSVNQLGLYAAVYDGGLGSDFSLMKIPFGGNLEDGRVVASLDSVTSAEIGFSPGSFTLGSVPGASLVPEGTMIYINDAGAGKPAWSDGTNWRDAAGAVLV